MRRKVYVGDWPICCSDMADALIDKRIIVTEEVDPRFFIEGSSALVHCPWCGVKLPTNKDTDQIYLDLLAAWGVAPLDEQEVKRVISEFSTKK